MSNDTQPLIKLNGQPIDTNNGFAKAELIQRAAERRRDGREPVRSFSDIIPAEDVADIESEENRAIAREGRTHRAAGIAVTAEVVQIPVSQAAVEAEAVPIRHDEVA